jgi:hypothetical protein
MGTVSAALGLYLVLLDAAVETVRSGSPVRWWVAGTVAAYFAAAAGVWQLRRPRGRSFGWGTNASASFVVLLGLVAATAWLPGGVSVGVTAFGLPTPTLLEAVAAAGVALAGVVVVRVPWIPAAAKWGFAAIATYGAAAFAYGAVAGTPFSTLLAGQSVWQRRPTVLQGAFLGGLVVLPLALLVSIVRAGLRGPQPDSLRRTLHECVALATSVAIVLAGVQLPGARGGAAPTREDAKGLAAPPAVMASASPGPSAAASAPPPAEDGAQLEAQMDRQFRPMQAFNSAVPADTYDPQAILAKVGREPVAIFHWVRDATLWVPYRGVLRGPVGVLMDRKGNDLDRSLLLAQLLSLSGQEARLARATLSDGQALGILQIVRSRAAVPSAPASGLSPDIRAFVEQYAKDNPAEAADVRSAADEAFQAGTQRAREISDRSVTQARTIAAIVGPFVAAGAAPGPSDLDRVRDHWWVQVHQGPNWTDFDPIAPQSEPGRPLVGAEATVGPDALDPQAYHEVEIRVITERWEQGRLIETPVLTHVLRPAAMYGIDVALVHLPIAWPQDFSSARDADPAKRSEEIGRAQHEWLPVLQVGSSIDSQFSFTDSGIKRNARPVGVGQLGTTVERGLGGVLGALGGADDHKAQTVLTGEWIEYEIRSPGEPARRIRRQLFDAIGAAQRASATVQQPKMTDRLHTDLALTLMGQTDILVLNCQLSRGFVAHLFARAWLADQEPLKKLMLDDAGSSSETDTLLAKIVPLPGPLYGLALARSQWSRYRNSVYIDRPGIMTAHEQFREGPDGRLVGAYSFDIVANDVATLPGSSTTPALVRLEQGVLDTAAEAMVGAEIDAGSAQDVRTVSNVSEMYRQTDQGVAWSAVRTVDDPALQKMEIGADARATLRQVLAAGYVVVAPNRPITLAGRPAVGWWRVDAKSGQTLGVDDRGWGQDLVEFAFIVFHTAFCMHSGIELARQAFARKSYTRAAASGVSLGFCLAGGGFGMLAAWGEWHALIKIATGLQIFSESWSLGVGAVGKEQ